MRKLPRGAWTLRGALTITAVSLALTSLSPFAEAKPCDDKAAADEGKESEKPKKKDAPKKDAPKKDAAKEDAPKKDAAKKDAEEPPKKSESKKQPTKKKKKKASAPRVTLSEPKLVGGEVKLVTKMLQKTLPKVAACVKDADGLDGKKGFIKLQFLVRVRGRAEGVEVLEHKGVTTKAAKCAQKLLKNRWVGTPSNDPVGVTFRYELAVRKG